MGRQGHGLNERERQVMAKFDAGMVVSDIARELGLAESYVHDIVQQFDFDRCWDNSNAFNRDARRGSANLAHAIAATGRAFA